MTVIKCTFVKENQPVAMIGEVISIDYPRLKCGPYLNLPPEIVITTRANGIIFQYEYTEKQHWMFLNW